MLQHYQHAATLNQVVALDANIPLEENLPPPERQSNDLFDEAEDDFDDEELFNLIQNEEGVLLEDI